MAYREAWALQRGLHRGPAGEGSADDHLLLLEHPHVYTLGRNADAVPRAGRPRRRSAPTPRRRPRRRRHLPRSRPARRLPDPAPAGEGRSAALPDTVAYVTLARGRPDRHARRTWACRRRSPHRLPRRVGRAGHAQARKIAAIGVRIERAGRCTASRSTSSPDLAYFGHIVPCGIEDYGVTSLAAEGVDVTMRQAVDAFVARFVSAVVPRLGRSIRCGLASQSDADLSPFSRGAGPGSRSVSQMARPTRVLHHRRAHAQTGGHVGAAARSAGRGGRRGRGVDHRPQARLDAGAGPPRIGASWASSTRCATSVWSRCARRRVVRTCRSAGPTAPPRSWCAASDAPAPAGSAWSTPATRKRSTPPSPIVWPRPSRGWASSSRSSRWWPATICPTGERPHVAATIRAIRARQPRHAGRGAHLRLQGRRRVAADRLRRPTRRDEPQHRDRARLQRAVRPSARLRPFAVGPGEVGRCRPHHQVGARGRHGRDRGRDRRRRSPTSPPSVSRS